MIISILVGKITVRVILFLVKLSKNTESSQKARVRLSHALFGPAVQEVRITLFDVSRIRNSDGLV